MDELPIIYIKVDFHFIRQTVTIGGQPQQVNFQCTDENNPYFAPDYVTEILNAANDMLSDPAQSNQTSAPDIPDTRIRFVLYEEPEDMCQSIFIHNSNPTSFTNSDALHVIVEDDAASGFSGMQDGQLIYLYNIHHAVFVLGYSAAQVGPAGRVMAHEAGHYAGLCHSHSTANVCPEFDPVDECNGSTSQSSCGGNDGSCTWNYSNNFMSNGSQTGMVFSQWVVFYNNLSEAGDVVVIDGDLAEALDDLCPCVEPSGTPLEIDNGLEEWDTPQFIETDVEIRAGSTLIISTWIVMAKNKKIIVNRGGRLFLQGGTIFGQSSECRWGGILVHGKATVDQPDIEDAQDKNYTLTSNNPGAVWVKDSEIHWAHTAIATKGSGSLNTFDYFGGLVMVDNSDFIDNGRAVEFMKYDRVNKSYFDMCQIISSESNPAGSDQGVSIWGCKGIKFDAVLFTGLREFGISGINYITEISDCIFDGVAATSGTAIHISSTYGNSIRGESLINDCEFKNYNKDIVALSTPDFSTRLKITDNDFSDPAGAAHAGIRIVGESYFDIANSNSFSDKHTAIAITSSGPWSNYIRCNNFNQVQYTSNNISGPNDNLVFFENDYDETFGGQIRLSGSGITSIAEMQGDEDTGAGNCFVEPDAAIVANPATTKPFFYFVYDPPVDPVDCELTPLGNLSDNGFNNYLLDEAEGEYPNCGSDDPTPYILTALSDARNESSTKWASYLALPTAQNYRAYLSALSHQDSVVQYLIQQAVIANDLDLADSLMVTEERKHFTRAVVGLRTSRGDFEGAEDILDTMTLATQDDEWFVDIMDINFKIEGSDTLYRLTSPEETLLTTIIESDTSILMGNACAILALCEGLACDFPVDTNQNLHFLPTLPQETSIDTYEIYVYPNPTYDVVHIQTAESFDENIVLTVEDILGRVIYEKNFRSMAFLKEQIHIQNPGVYYIIAWVNNEPKSIRRLIVHK